MEWINETLQQWEGVIAKSTVPGLTKNTGKQLFASSVALNKQFINESADGEGYTLSGPSNIKGVGPVQMPNWSPGTSFEGQTPGSGDTPAYVGMAFNIAAQTIAFDLLPSIPIYSDAVLLDYVDAVYTGGSFSKTEKPIIFTVNVAGLDFAKAAPGNKVAFAVANSDKAIVVRMIAKHRTKANAYVVKYIATADSITIADGVYTVDETLTLKGIIDAGITKVVYYTGDTFDSNANATGVTLDYTSVQQNHTSYGSSDTNQFSEDPMEREEAEEGTRNVVEFKTQNKVIRTKEYENIGIITRQQARQFKSKGIDAVPALKTVLQQVVTQSINKHVLRTMRAMGTSNHTNMYLAQGLNMHLFVGPASTASKALTAFNIKFKDTAGVDQRSTFGSIANHETNSAAENSWTRQNALAARILAACHAIGAISRFGAGDFAVVGPQHAAALKNATSYQGIKYEGSISQSTKNLYYLGDIAGVKLYSDPTQDWNDVTVVCGRSNKDPMGVDWNNIQPGLLMGVYDLLSSVELLSEQAGGAPKVIVYSVYALAQIGMEPQLTYLTFGAHTDFQSWV